MTKKYLDLHNQLRTHINSLGLYAQANVGLLGKDESMAIMAMPGGATIEYMDGSRDKALQVQINAKSQNQLNCYNALNYLASYLEMLEALPSANDSYDYQNINITSLPSFLGQDEQNYYIYTLSFSVNIHIKKGVV